MHCPYCGTGAAKAEQRHDSIDLITLDGISCKIPSVVVTCDFCDSLTRVID